MTAISAVPSEPPLTDEAALSDAELAEIEARADAATPGPWDMAIHTHPLASCRCGSCTTDPIGYAVDHKLANYCDDIVAGSDDIDGCDKGPLLTYADASFAAAAREDVPRLVASLRSAREELMSARAERQELIAERDQARAELAALKATPRGDRFERIAAAVDAASYAIHDTRTLGRPLSDVEIATIAIDSAYDVLRRAFAEEAATALEAKSGVSFASYARAAEIVRQIGGVNHA